MLIHPYAYQNIRKQLSFKDQYKYNFANSDIKDFINDMSNIIQAPNYKINNFTTTRINNKTTYKYSNKYDDFALRCLNSNILQVYKVKQSNRLIVVRQIISLLKEEIPAEILRIDIRSFYESINRKKIFDKINRDCLLTIRSRNFLKQIDSQLKRNNVMGLPRGICISASISELFMRDIDKEIKLLDGVYFYARYVDDIIIFATNNIKGIQENVKEILNNNDLTLNERKTRSILKRDEVKKESSLEFLGYNFKLSRNGQKKEDLEITLAHKKIIKIKSRIIYSFLDHYRKPNFDLLTMRISFLTGNYILRHNHSNGKLRAGIYYNYPYVNDFDIFVKLNKFLRTIIFISNKNSLGQKINNSLDIRQKNILKKYNFASGFKEKRLYSFTYKQLAMIKGCWRNG